MPFTKTGPKLPREIGNEDPLGHIAKRLHDGPCQTFSGAHLLAQILLRDAEADREGDGNLQKELAAMIAAGVHELHEILCELREIGEPPDTPSSPPGATDPAQP